ncbi:MAG: helix-turn-helix domain-containing protein, partial [Moorellaceae bacterium]
RQLENAMLYAVTMCKNGVIYPEDLPEEIAGGAEALPTVRPLASSVAHFDSSAVGKQALSMKELEKRAIIQALVQTNYNVREAAAILGLGQSTLYRKIREYNLTGR